MQRITRPILLSPSIPSIQAPLRLEVQTTWIRLPSESSARENPQPPTPIVSIHGVFFLAGLHLPQPRWQTLRPPCVPTHTTYLSTSTSWPTHRRRDTLLGRTASPKWPHRASGASTTIPGSDPAGGAWLGSAWSRRVEWREPCNHFKLQS